MSSKIASAVRNTTSAGGPGPEKGEDADAERDVGRHRDAPTALPGSSPVEGQEDPGRDTIPPRPLSLAARLRYRVELPGDQLSLDLHSHEEEEDRHEAVVDQVPQTEGLHGVARSSVSG